VTEQQGWLLIAAVISTGLMIDLGVPSEKQKTTPLDRGVAFVIRAILIVCLACCLVAGFH